MRHPHAVVALAQRLEQAAEGAQALPGIALLPAPQRRGQRQYAQHQHGRLGRPRRADREYQRQRQHGRRRQPQRSPALPLSRRHRCAGRACPGADTGSAG
ncbi:hypothetical protein ACFOPN_07500 [Xanthomonas hyacinthi]|uniref:hypothetical protein n=1 Tax=Xanthomonas hyacinthi TaxID=56455 RepID=UPI003608D9B3